MNKKELKILLAIAAISFIQGLQYSVSPVLNAISEHYPDASTSMVQMLITMPGLVSVVIALISGVLVTKISKKRLLFISSLGAGITGFLPYLADSFPLLFAARAIYGIPLGLATALNSAVVSEFFRGEKRVKAMGIQSASVGIGMAVITSLAGVLGGMGFRTSYLVNIIGFICFAVIALFLPETGRVKVTESEPIRLNKIVWITSIFGFFGFFFLITFTTNIAMHLSGKLAGDTSAAGLITSVYSVAQILIGLVLGSITKRAGKYTMAVAFAFFTIGGVLLIFFPSALPMLVIGALFCGFSQGAFMPTGFVEVSNAVNAASAAMAAAVFTAATCFGQFMSPIFVNGAAKVLLGEAGTRNVYIIASAGMAITAALLVVWKSTLKEQRVR